MLNDFRIFVDEEETDILQFPKTSPLHGHYLRVKAELAHGDQVAIDSSAVVGRSGKDDQGETMNEYTLDARKHNRLLMRSWIVAWTFLDEKDVRRGQARVKAKAGDAGGADGTPAAEPLRERSVNNAMIDRLTHRAAKEIMKVLQPHIDAVQGEIDEATDPLPAD
jgi:hypothetical protein